ncbi:MULTISPECIES: DUF3017 domain-containing protein [Gordonia]|uniref:DUF3017 domain-containing protein n=2 Tax=Gordonia TaxID=2053 RepID=L7LM58_9ACTN|nr:MULTISPECIES: DUF3017 domain-containing protein [Gordonia]AUH69581.1 DUF3017 domain-containing protein [Gordonia sp. YC-JH1]MBY4569418.1 hypothetical protein [Gordonia sihwensis]GAC61826.1 hypothetical protein GSI01S_24_00230 [Gordonia sihwensis NBRC 108236]
MAAEASGGAAHDGPVPVDSERVESMRRARKLHGFIANVPYYTVLAVIAVAALLVLIDRWRRGAFVFGSAMLLGAVFRAFLPANRVGLLQVRSRVFDICAMAALGGTVLWLATSIDSLGTA